MKFAEALHVIQSAAYAEDQSFPIVLCGIVMAGRPGRKGEAEKTIVDAIRACRGGALLSYIPAYLQLLGPEYGAKTLSSSWRSVSDRPT